MKLAARPFRYAAALTARLSNTASHADLWISSWPGSEAALLLGVARQLLKSDRINRDFLRRWTNWEEFLGSQDGQGPGTFDDFVKRAYMGRVSLSATGFYATPKIHWDKVAAKGRPFYYFAYGAAVSESVIDTLTGENRLARVDILHDVGKSLNPAIDLGQIEGGFIQGVGWLTTEELWWNDKGELKTHAPSTYKIPACSDRAPDTRVQ